MIPKLSLFLFLHERLVTFNVFNVMENKGKKLKNVDYLKNCDTNRKKYTKKMIIFNFKCANQLVHKQKSFSNIGWTL